MTQNEAILAELRRCRPLDPRYWPTAETFYRICGTHAASSRIDEIRKKGHRVMCIPWASSENINNRYRYHLDFDAERDGAQ
jgi:hypothetical protein